MPHDSTLTPSQAQGLHSLINEKENTFLTGGPGTGKSFLIKEYLKLAQEATVTASTGAAAILIRGRTFHSFFGLGIMQGGPKAVAERAFKNNRLKKRLRKITTLVIDEVSMLSRETLDCAEHIARTVRKSVRPWGGIRVIAVGDFAQLPPISNGLAKPWCFLGEAWHRSRFNIVVLKEPIRTRDQDFLDVLEDIRWGNVSDRVKAFLDEHVLENDRVERNVPHLFPRRIETEAFNRVRLVEISEQARIYQTRYEGEPKYVERLARDAPIPHDLELKQGALVMFRVNHPKRYFVNGTVGTVAKMKDDSLVVRTRWREVHVEPFTFSLLDEDGNEAASACNFPVNLAYASTIHKVQGATLTRAHISLKQLWEAGQAYVALSRVRRAAGVTIMNWDQASIKSDPAVQAFYEQCRESAGTAESICI